MIKSGLFTIGLISGAYIGINLREKGVTAGLIRAYRAYKQEDIKTKLTKSNMTIDDINELYRQGLLNDESIEKFKKMLFEKRFDKIDEIVVNDLNNIFGEQYLSEMIRMKNQNIYKY
jgi:hypothetical protein